VAGDKIRAAVTAKMAAIEAAKMREAADRGPSGESEPTELCRIKEPSYR
jgi:hypothetical protein